jgi:hypothetical protein
MAAFLQKARRSAILRHAKIQLELERASAPETELTPPPVAVAIAAGALDAPLVASRAPISRPRGWRRLVVGFAALTLCAGGVVAAGGAPRAAAEAQALGHAAAEVRARGLEATLAQALVAVPALSPAPAPAAPEVVVPVPAWTGPRADAHVNRDGYGHIPGGVVFVPSTFASADGSYDLYLHFHGNTRVVLESAEHAGLDAIVAVVNLGVNSAPYLDAYEAPGAYERTLASIARVLGERGLEHASVRRVAIGSWSGGYGAVSRVLEHDTGTETLDAVLVLDGIHCGFLDDGSKALNARIISPFLTGAKRAAEGKMLFSITHSEIDPIAYAGTDLTAGYLLSAVHGQRGEPSPAPEHLQLRAAEGAVARRLEKRMEPVSEATVGSFHVRGYRGNTPEHHMAHLFQMGATVLPELAERWRSFPSR